jgi:hypothetical protein
MDRIREKIEDLGDRLVGLVVPKTKAGACECFPSDTWWQFCYCSPTIKGMSYYRRHDYGCHCQHSVTACMKHLTDICL